MKLRHCRFAVAVVVLVALMFAPSAPRAQFPGIPGKIAFVRSPAAGSPSDIFTINPDGTGLRRLTAASGDYRALDWSADGSKLAFEKVVEDTNEIWVMNSKGSNARRVSEPGVSRYHPAWSPDGRYLAVDDGISIYRLDITTGTETLLKDRDTLQTSCLGQPYELQVRYGSPVWSPDGGRIALIRMEEYPPDPVFDICDPSVDFKFDLAVMSSAGGSVTMLTDDPLGAGGRYDGLPDWSPDGTQIAWMRGTASSMNGIAVIPADGGTPTILANGFGGRPRWSPDGTKILFTRDQDRDGDNELWTMNPADGSDLTPLLQDDNHNLYQDWQPIGGGIEVTLDAFAPDGTSLRRSIALAQQITVELTIANTGELELRDFAFAGDAPLVIDDRSTGGLEIVSGPDPGIDPGLVLQSEEEVKYTFEVTTTANGIAAAHTKVTAEDADGAPRQDAHSLRFDIADGAQLIDDLGRWVILQAMDQFLQEAFGTWYDGMAQRGRALRDRLAAVLSRRERRQWFGAPRGLPLTPFDFATALVRGVAPEMVAASLPKQQFKGYTVEELNRAYNESFKEEVGKGVSQWVKGWTDLGATAKKGLEDSWSEVMLASFYVFGTATPEERAQFEAYAMTLMDGTASSSRNVYNTIKREIPRWQENLRYLDEALEMAVSDALLLSPDLQAQMAAESEWRQNVLELADTDPVAFQRAWAQRDAEIANLGLPLVLDTLVGGGVFRGGGALKDVVVRGRGAAVLRAGRAVGVIDAEGNVVSGAKTAIKPSTSKVPRGVPAGDVAELERTGGYLDNVEGATVVRSSDLGNVYELPNLGGVPEVTLEAKAGILGQLEGEYAAATGRQIKLAEVLKPSSPLRKPGGVAKLELTGQKTGKPAMLDAGAPPDVLGEANVWHSPTHPRDLPGFRSLSKVRQQAAIDEWKLANERWTEWLDPPPGSKTARLKQCIGRRSRVPLDTAPNKAGIQRFVTAEFEEVTVAQGNAEAKLVRVKHYEVEVVDTRTGRTVNRKTVVDSPEAVPQTPDADGVAVAKVVGTDAAGRPILEPLSRSEREFVMQRYIDKNIKARRKPPGTPGAIPDNAEHGVTLVMDDASAQAAGKLLARYGIPFLPERIGLSFLKRIAPFVSKAGATPAQIKATYEQLLAVVRSEGGFGKHAVVVTSDSRYLGEVPFSSW